jgi:hypothetical protein
MTAPELSAFIAEVRTDADQRRGTVLAENTQLGTGSVVTAI